MRERAHGLLVHRGVTEVDREGACLEPALSKGAHEYRGELLHVDRASHRAAAKAQLLRRGVIVDASGYFQSQIAWLSVGADQHSVLFDDLVESLCRRHLCTSLSVGHYTPPASRYQSGSCCDIV